MKIKGLLIIILLGAISISGQTLWASTRVIWEDHERGWFWYEPFRGLPEEPKKKKPSEKKHTTRKKTPSSPVKQQKVSYRELLAEIRRELEEIRARALLDPTPENVAAWYVAQILTMRMAGDFTRASLLVPVLYPELDVSAILPGSQWGSQVLAYSDSRRKQAILSELATRGALVIFYRSPGCFLCDREMDALRSMKKLYGFKIYALYEGEAPFWADRAKPITPELEERLGVKTYPSLFYFRDGRFHFVGMGALGTSEIERRLLLLARSEGWTTKEPLYALDQLPIWKELGLDQKSDLSRLLRVLKRLKEKGFGKEITHEEE